MTAGREATSKHSFLDCRGVCAMHGGEWGATWPEGRKPKCQHEVVEPDCEACMTEESDAPEWTL